MQCCSHALTIVGGLGISANYYLSGVYVLGFVSCVVCVCVCVCVCKKTHRGGGGAPTPVGRGPSLTCGIFVLRKF